MKWNFGLFWSFVTFSSELVGLLALRDVSVAIPSAVAVGDTVALQCRYNLEGEPLYTVKWYKGKYEFYRYLPKELPNTQIFHIAGVHIDTQNSSPNRVILKDASAQTTGRYRCEVSTDSPNFFTSIETGYMYVIDIPDGQPNIAIEKEQYEVGKILTGNCTSPPSFPPFNLTWFANGKSENAASIVYVPDKHNHSQRLPKVTIARLELQIKEDTFLEGKVHLQCVATLFHLHQTQADLVLEAERPRPRPSSVLGTRGKASGLSLIDGFLLFSFILLLISIHSR